jgi:UV DNA damage endonuclease
MNKKPSLCCISLNLGHKASKMTRSSYLKLDRSAAVKQIGDLTLHNVNIVYKTIQYCILNNWNYRISSGMMPLETLPNINLNIEELYNFKQIKSMFDLTAALIKKHNVRCSTHPDQFVVPASAKPEVVKKSVHELALHGKMMDMFGLSQDYNSPINIHMNSFLGYDLKDIAKRFIDVYHTFPDNVKSRFVLECEDKKNSWNVQQLYDYIYSEVKIPITYDSHHFRLNNPTKMSPKEAIKLCMSTWGSYRPLFHYSNGRVGETDRAHANFPDVVHDELFDEDVDVEFEFKMKDQAILYFQMLWKKF